MNNASLHVCVSIIQTNHYIYSIIFIMNYSPAWSACWQSNRHPWVWIQEAAWRFGLLKTDVLLPSNWTSGKQMRVFYCVKLTYTWPKDKHGEGSNSALFCWRTKWKRQTAVGLELLAEAGNYSALQRMFPSPYFYPQSLVSNLDPGAALYLYRGPSAPPPSLQRPLVPRILLHGLQGGSEPLPPPLPPMSGVLPRPPQQRWAGLCRQFFFISCTPTWEARDPRRSS